MRVTKYVKSDGESWMMVQIRCSAHVSYDRLNKLMRENGWIPYRLVKEKFDQLRKRLAATNPIKYPNWKQVVIPMHKAGLKDLPAKIAAENEKKNLEILEPLEQDIPFTDADVAAANKPISFQAQSAMDKILAARKTTSGN